MEKNDKLPTEKDKDNLLEIINSMDKETHMYIFLNFLFPLQTKINHLNYLNNLNDKDNKLYTITNDATMFDLNDLEEHVDVFWNIYNYSILYKDNILRKNKIKECEKEYNETIKLLEDRLNNDYEELKLKAQSNINSNNIYM